MGVLPSGFELPIPGMRNADLWFPVRVPLTSNDPSNGGLLCLGLLNADRTPVEAEAALTLPLVDLRREFPKMFAPNERARLQPLHTFLADWAGPAPLLLFGAVTLVLLIACANVANLTLVRSSSRQREIAIRTSMGAGRGRIARQLLTESVLLALLGGGLGVLACRASFHVILSLIPADIPHVGAITIDGQVLLFALLLSVITGMVFGIVPALGASRLDLNASLKEASVRIGSSGQGRLRNALAVSEVSISLVLLMGAALALESFAKLTRVPPGFDPHNLLTFNVTLPGKRYDTPTKRAAFFEQAVADLQTHPGVDDAALVSVPPLEGGPDILFSMEGAGAPQASDNLGAEFRFVGAGYFQTLRIPLLRGRSFSSSDRAEAAPVVIINQTMAKMYWPNQNALGQRIWVGKPMGPAEAEPAPREIVGIVSDIREMTLAEPPAPTMYIPYSQHPQADGAYFLLRSRLNPAALIPDIRSTMQRLGPGSSVAEVKTMEQILTASLTDWRFHAILLGTFGALALFIAAIGIYGVISYSVAQRTHEFGVRLALGAATRDVLTMVVKQGAILAAIGIAIGLAAAFGLMRLMASLLYGVRASDPLTFVAVSLLLAGVALLASYIPARRAMKVDPMVALRYE
jgi:predicted permease